MKKNYFMLAAATMMLAACAETDLVNEIAVEETPQAIGFETFAQKATREDGETELSAHHSSFYVWGYKMVPSIVTAFDKVTVTYNENSTQQDTKWEYAPLRYWDKTATSYEFYAATPVGENWQIVTTDNSGNLAAADYYLTLSDFTLTDHDATDLNNRDAAVVSFNSSNIDKDLMISTSETKFALVDFTFKHILARLNVTVQKPSTFTETITVTEFQVYNLNDEGDYTHKANPTWSSSKTNSGITYNTVEDCELTTSAQYLLQSLVIPQTANHTSIPTDGSANGNNPYIWIQYTIQDETIDNSTAETFDAYYNLADVFGNEDLPLEEAYQYNLNITISPEAIKFTGDVVNWEVDKDNAGNDKDYPLTIE